MSHFFSYLSSLSLVTDPIAVASNNCAIDHLHKDHCAQAFGRNTLSKPHSTKNSALGKTECEGCHHLGGNSSLLVRLRLLICWKFESERMMLENPNAIVAVEVRRSNDANAMGVRERHGESNNGQKVWHTIVVLREIADKSWELVNSSNKRLNNGEWTGWNQKIVKLTN